LPEVGFGFITIGTITLEPYAGNPKPRLGRFPKSKALLVNKGLKTIGARAVISKLKNLTFTVPIGISIGATNRAYKNSQEQIDNYYQCFQLFEESKVSHSYYELNISCPNTFGGEPFTTISRLDKLLTTLNKLKISRPVYIKMPIDLSEEDILNLLNASQKYRFISGVIFGNLTKDHNNPHVHPDDSKLWAKSIGNLSGAPTFHRSNQLIALTKKHFAKRFTIIGCGGIFSTQDAQTKLDLGADLVQLITGMIYQGPQLIVEINRSLRP
jgi:dihydroorotate dehydrogenase